MAATKGPAAIAAIQNLIIPHVREGNICTIIKNALTNFVDLSDIQDEILLNFAKQIGNYPGVLTYLEDKIKTIDNSTDIENYTFDFIVNIDTYVLNYIQYTADIKAAAAEKAYEAEKDKFIKEEKKTSDAYIKTRNSYSGSDITATITLPGRKPVIIGEVQTLSYSIYRPKAPVRALGRINPKGYVKGTRTIAGSLIFTVFDKHIVYQLMNTEEDRKSRIITDEMPPFDITITLANEYGSRSQLSIYGVEIVSEGQTMSIEDMLTENVMSYVANGIELLK